LVAAESLGSTPTPCLHCATAAATEGVFAAPLVAVELAPVEPPVAAVLLELTLLELLELELELPQPAANAVAASSTSADGKSVRIIGRPLDG
jgi:hypothetical protein